MKYLITGYNGFVGQYLIDYISTKEPDAEIIGIDINAIHSISSPCFDSKVLNLLDQKKLHAVIEDVKPDYLVHLASLSSVGESWQNPIDSFSNNTNIFLNLLEAVRSICPDCRVLSIGSSEEYGMVSEKDLPLTEQDPLSPISPYAVARVAQEHLSRVYAKGYKLDIVCTRSFNHIGAGQADKFVVSSIGKKFVEFKKGIIDQISVGNTEVVRDFLDVKDVVSAYYLLLKKGVSGEVYNICSGKGVSIADIIKFYKNIVGVIPEIQTDQNLLRPIENRIVIGSNRKICSDLKWQVTIALKQTLKDVIKFWERTVTS